MNVGRLVASHAHLSDRLDAPPVQFHGRGAANFPWDVCRSQRSSHGRRTFILHFSTPPCDIQPCPHNL